MVAIRSVHRLDKLAEESSKADQDLCIVLGLLSALTGAATPEFVARVRDPLVTWLKESFPGNDSFVYLPQLGNRFTAVSLATGRKLCRNCSTQQIARQKFAIVKAYTTGGSLEHAAASIEAWTERLTTDSAALQRQLTAVTAFVGRIRKLKETLVAELKSRLPHRGNMLYVPCSDTTFTAVSLVAGRVLCRCCTPQQIARQKYAILQCYT